MKQKTVNVDKLKIGNNEPLTLFGGLNVLEDFSLAQEVCHELINITNSLGMQFVFKASFDKANRSSYAAYRGPGIEKGLKQLSALKKEFNVPILTDVHEPYQASIVAEVADILQLPAFLCRQTDLVKSLAETNKVINIKKAQFLSPQSLQHVIEKFTHFGNKKILLCERGSMFGYSHVVVDMLSFPIMKKTGYPVVFDITHSLQLPGNMNGATGGRSDFAQPLALSAVAQGLSAIFLETHPHPKEAKCDGASATPLAEVKTLLQQLKKLDNFIKNLH